MTLDANIATAMANLNKRSWSEWDAEHKVAAKAEGYGPRSTSTPHFRRGYSQARQDAKDSGMSAVDAMKKAAAMRQKSLHYGEGAMSKAGLVGRAAGYEDHARALTGRPRGA